MCFKQIVSSVLLRCSCELYYHIKSDYGILFGGYIGVGLGSGLSYQEPQWPNSTDRDQWCVCTLHWQKSWLNRSVNNVQNESQTSQTTRMYRYAGFN